MCESSDGEGDFAGDEGSTGTIKLTFHGCGYIVLGFHVACTTEGQPSGTIATTELEFHVKRHSGKPVMLITSTEGHFAPSIAAAPVTYSAATASLAQSRRPATTNRRPR